MSELITDEELKSCKSYIKSMELDDCDYSDIDYAEVKDAILLSPLAEDRVKLNHMNQGGSVKVEADFVRSGLAEKYYPVVDVAVECDFIQVKPIGFIKEIISRINQFFKNLKVFSTEEKGMKKVMMDYIQHLDTHYLSMRKSVMEIESRYDNQLTELLFLLPDLTVYFVKFLAADEVPNKVKRRIAAILLYIIVPVDMIPEQILGAIGYIDDVYIAVFTVLEMMFGSELSDETIRKYWPGKSEDLLSLKEKGDDISGLLGGNLVGIIKRFFEKKRSGKSGADKK